MGSELVLYGYLFVCLSMLVFNIVYNIVFSQRNKRLERQTDEFSRAILMQMERIQHGGQVDSQHLALLRRKLPHADYLIAFENALSRSSDAPDHPAAVHYRQEVFPVLFDLAQLYAQRENMQAAYFAYFLSRFKPRKDWDVETLQRLMVEYMKRPSLYCRVNALLALYEFGSEENLTQAIILLDREDAIPHEKILTDGLLSFQGDHKKLIGLLWEKFPKLSQRIRLSVLNYIRFKSGDYCEEVLGIMQNQSEDKELRISAIRYFGRYPYAPAKESLLSFASDKRSINWEYAAVAVSCLGPYPGQDVIEVLMEAAHSSNWYVRLNAATALESHHLDYNDLISIFSGNDRYAREMMMYRLDHKRMLERTSEVTL